MLSNESINIKRHQGKQIALPQVGGILAVLFAGFVFLFRYVFSFDLMIGDVKTYWELSLNRSYLFHHWWVPGYPFIISLVRSASLDLLPPTVLMQLLSGFGYIAGGVGVYLLFKDRDAKLAVICAGFYALFPFTGVVYAAFPIADSLALAALVYCFYFLHKENWPLMAISIAVALLLQKITWFFIPLILLFAFIRYRQSRLYMVIACVPILLYFGAGAIVKQDLFWVFRWSTENLLTPMSSLPILDGVIGPFLIDLSLPKLLKSIVVVIIFIVSAVALIVAFRQKQYQAITIPAGLVLMALIVNQYEIWALVRYSKLLSIPIGMIVINLPRLYHGLSRPIVLVAALFGFLLSNLAYVYYLINNFYGA
jgi:hypothetical protein